MPCHRTVSRFFWGASLCSLLLAACSTTTTGQLPPPPQQEAATPSRKPVARVNGREITLNELNRAKQILLAGQPGLKIPPQLAKEFEKQALEKLISAELLFQAGQKLEIPDLERQADAKMAQIRSGFREPALYEKELRNIDMTEAMLRDYTRRDLAIANLVNSRIAPTVKVSEEEIARYYQENPERFLQEEKVRVSHILVPVAAKAGAGEREKARAKAEKLRAELSGGAEFAKLARENSSCPSAASGGDLGYFGKGTMAPPFEKAAFDLKAGELGPVVETEYGYHLIMKSDHIKGEKVPLATARQKLEAFLKTQKVNSAISDFVGEARKSAKVELLLP